MTIGLDGVSELDESDQSDDSTDSGNSSSSDDEYPKYYRETPFLAVIQDGDSLKVRNEPADCDVVYRQYQKGSDTKLWEEPDDAVEYWLTDWQFRSSSHRYEQETGRSLIDDLRQMPEVALDRLRVTSSGSGVSRQRRRCSVCRDELRDNDDFVRIQSKPVCADHTTAEIVDADVLNIHTSKEVTDNKGETVRKTPDTKNRRWE